MQQNHCDIETGVCQIDNEQEAIAEKRMEEQKKSQDFELLYFTDPICSACYIFEQALQPFLQKHRHEFSYSIHMGGLVPDKDSFFDPANGIHAATDVGRHWREMGQHFGMDLNVSMWENDPMDSSYPSSIAFKAAELQSKMKAEDFLNRLREAVFSQGENIEHQETIDKYASKAGLDLVKLHQDQAGRATKAFFDDLTLMRQLGVRGFPSLLFRAGDKYLSLSGIRTEQDLDRFLQEAKRLNN